MGAILYNRLDSKMYYLVISHDKTVMQALELPQFPKEKLPELQETIQEYSKAWSCGEKYEIIPISKLSSREIRELKELNKQYNARIERWKESGKYEAYQYLDPGLILLNQIEDINDKLDAVAKESEADPTDKPETVAVDAPVNEKPLPENTGKQVVKVPFESRHKGGRPTNLETDTICIHIILAFLHLKNHATKDDEYKDIKKFAYLLEQRIKRAGGNIKVNYRKLDARNKAGRLYRYCLRRHFGSLDDTDLKYTEKQFEVDEPFANECYNKTKEYLGRMGDTQKKGFLEKLLDNGKC